MQQARAPKSLFDEIIALLEARKLEQAMARCQSVLQSYPGDVNILGLLGAVQGDSGQLKAAEKTLLEVIDLAPGFAKPYEDLGILLLQQKRAEEAIPVLEKSVRLNPAVESAQFNLGKALAQTGRGKEADVAFEASFELSPTRKMMALAAEHHKAGRFEPAEKLCRQVLQHDRNHVDALRMLGLLAAAAGELEECENLLRQVLTLAPDHVPAMFELGRVYKELDQYEDAIAILEKLTALQPNSAKAHFRLATALGPAARTEESVAAYQRCLELQPEHPGALLGLGHMLKTLGRQEEGVAAYLRCIELSPDNGEVYYSLANLKTYQFSDTLIEEMKQRVAKDSVVESAESQRLQRRLALLR
jgi:tetratricopeptide (TPR) repeat protein